MTQNRVAPQAYTKDTLAKAYEWISQQSKEIQAQATSADVLVSIYLRACRHGEASLSPLKSPQHPSLSDAAPVSAQHFKSDLKDLALGMKEFDSNEVQHEVIHHPPKTQTISSSAHSTQYETRLTERVMEVKTPQPQNDLVSSDSKTTEMVVKVRDRFNLSSNTEAARMLITLGFEQVKKMFPSDPKGDQ